MRNMRRGGLVVVVVIVIVLGKGIDSEGCEQARIRGRQWDEIRGHITDEGERRIGERYIITTSRPAADQLHVCILDFRRKM